MSRAVLLVMMRLAAGFGMFYSVFEIGFIAGKRTGAEKINSILKKGSAA